MDSRVGSVKGLISLYENKISEASSQSKAYGGRQIRQQPLSQSGQKVNSLAKETMSRTKTNQPEASKKRFFEGFKPPPPAPSSEEWSKEAPLSKNEQSPAWQKKSPGDSEKAPQAMIGKNREQVTAQKDPSWQKASPTNNAITPQATIGKSREQTPAQKVNEKIHLLWQKTQPRSTSAISTPAPMVLSHDHKHLQIQISQFSMAIKHITENKGKKFTIAEDGKFSIVKRGIGRTSGTTEATKNVIKSLDRLGQEVLQSDDPELIIRYNQMLKDLRNSPWGRDLEKNNPSIRANFETLANVTRSWLEKGAPTGQEVKQALDIITKSTDRKELFEALKTLRQTSLTQSLSEDANLEVTNNGIKAALAALRRVDENAITAQLMGQDPDVEARELLLVSAGWVLKGQDFISPIQKSLAQIADMPPDTATIAFGDLANAAIQLATLSKKELKENSDQGSSLQEELERIKDLALKHKYPAIQQQGRALEALLKEPPSSEELNTALNNFKTALQHNDLSEALTHAEVLTFMPKTQLSLPINSKENSLTLRQELERLRDSIPDQSGTLSALLKANAEKISYQPLATSLKDRAIDKENLLQGIRSGSLKGKDREEAIRTLKEDFRAQSETSVASISTREFTKITVSGKEDPSAPNLHNAIKSYNNTTSEIKTQFLISSNFEEAKSVLQFYVDLMEQCLGDKNFYGAFAIYSGLISPSLDRFIPVMLDKRQQAAYEKATAIFNPQGSYKELRATISEAAEAGQKPVPVFSYLLSDLNSINEGNPDKIDGKVNLEKAGLIQQNINLFKKYRDQLSIHPERNSNFFQEPSTKFINNRGTFDDKAAYDRSLDLMSRADLSALKTKLGVTSS
ncbi:MAG: RasGEF domain-containing protein [Parachlamydiaceae bacterium]